jgi:hypothetical protein
VVSTINSGQMGIHRQVLLALTLIVYHADAPMVDQHLMNLNDAESILDVYDYSVQRLRSARVARTKVELDCAS